MSRVRVASLQYFIRPVKSYEDFALQVKSLVDTAKDYKVHLLTFPEYFTTQLLTLGNIEVPISEQIRNLARQEERIVETISKLAKKSGITIVGGSLPGFDESETKLLNKCYVFGTDGSFCIQPKLHMTRFESEEWMVSAGTHLKLIETSFGKFAVAICYDVEFPEIARAAARLGAHFLVVPSCTDDRHGYLRVRYCGQARAIENQMYVIQSSTVGSLPMVPAVSMNYGQAAIYTPSDYSFARDGLLAEGTINQEMMIIGDLNLPFIEETRKNGTVLPLRDSVTTAEVLKTTIHAKI